MQLDCLPSTVHLYKWEPDLWLAKKQGDANTSSFLGSQTYKHPKYFELLSNSVVSQVQAGFR
jgi:hypothetical protein